MNVKQLSLAVATGLLVTSAFAQTAGKPLNLKLPPSSATTASAHASVPASSSSAAKPAGSSTAPGVYYGDTSGKIENDTRVVDDSTTECDDSKYNQPQMHGSVSTGMVSASHGGSGSWSGGEVNLSQAFGSCDHPTGGMSISIGGETGRFHGH
ncbi:hypothetical protein [Rhodanobacter sp. L36]|uniref:hypothetical protein n=1 Tax=Rhodanobacter sp. L36 TaxID=1747221 RepID=UPI001576C3F6|nr:hypothetical protein [Rhodanobacter sp. L36]